LFGARVISVVVGVSSDGNHSNRFSACQSRVVHRSGCLWRLPICQLRSSTRRTLRKGSSLRHAHHLHSSRYTLYRSIRAVFSCQ